EFSRDPDRVGRFQREAEVLASLNHPNIAAIYDLEESQGSRFLILRMDVKEPNPTIHQIKGDDSMLGEQIGEFRGKRILRKVLSSDPLRVEVSFEDGGTIFGIDANGFGTYVSQLRPDGTLYGEGEIAYVSK